MKSSDPLLLTDDNLYCGMYPAGKVDISQHLAIPRFPQSDGLECLSDFRIVLNPLCIMCSPHHSFPSSIIISSRQKKTALSVNTEGKRPNWKLWPLCVSRHVSNTVLASSIFHQKALVNSTVNYMIECLCHLIFTLNVYNSGILRYVRYSNWVHHKKGAWRWMLIMKMYCSITGPPP